MDDRIQGSPRQMPGAAKAPPANAASSAAPGSTTDGVVHDLGNLIQIARSAVNIISRDPTVRAAGALAPAIAHANASLERAGALVRQSIGAAHHPAMVEILNIAECLEEFAPMLRYVSGPAIRIDLQLGPVPKVMCNRLGLQNAILNLVINARDAMPEGGVITVAAEFPEGPETADIELAVADNGAGMTPEVIARAFTPYFTTKAKDHGSGVGLAMVKRFAVESNGRVSIQSRPGLGTTVTIRLPVAMPPAGAAATGFGGGKGFKKAVREWQDASCKGEA